MTLRAVAVTFVLFCSIAMLLSTRSSRDASVTYLLQVRLEEAEGSAAGVIERCSDWYDFRF